MIRIDSKLYSGTGLYNDSDSISSGTKYSVW